MPQRRNGHSSEQAKPTSDNLINRLPGTARQAADTVRQTAGEALSSAGQKADDLAASLGGGMQSLAGNIRSHAPSQETLGQLASGVADLLDRAGHALQEEGISGLAGELNDLIRRYPVTAVFVAAGAGFLLAQTSRR